MPGAEDRHATEILAPVVIGPENITVAAETTLRTAPDLRVAWCGAERAPSWAVRRLVYAEPGQAAGSAGADRAADRAGAGDLTDALVRSLQNDLRLQQRNLERDKRLAKPAVSTRVVEADCSPFHSRKRTRRGQRTQVVARRSLDRDDTPLAGIVSEHPRAWAT
jgi:hypothetical protein